MSSVDMRAVVPRQPGGPEVLSVVRRPIPRPAADQVVIDVSYAGVNRHDCGQRMRGAPPAGATDILGLEVSGHIIGKGDDVTDLNIGDAVCALVNGGGYADFCLAEAALVFPRVDAFNLAEMAALPEALFTAWFNLFEVAGLREDMSVLIHGGSSGVGAIAIQMARAFGVDVLATAGSDEKCSVCEGLGARRAINYRSSDFVIETLTLTAGHGVHVILDMVGVAYLDRNLRALARDGTIVHLTSGASSLGEESVAVPLRQIMERRANVTGTLLRGLEAERKRNVAAALKDRVWHYLGTAIKPIVDSTFPLESAEAAHRRIESGETIGKIVLDARR